MSDVVTIQNIAKACGVSIASVSRALSGKSYVKPETRQRIMECATAMGYEYAKSKAKHGSKIMLIVGDLSNQFYMGIIRGVNQQLAGRGYKVAIFNSDYDSAQEEEYVSFAYADGYDGIIMLTAIETASLISLLQRNTCPVVLVNRFIRSMDLDAVCIDNRRGGYMAASYLIEKGHRKIAHLAGPQNSTASQDRLFGFQNALRDSKIAFSDEAVFVGDLMRGSGERFAAYYMKHLRDYTAVFCANDVCAASFVESLQEQGVRVPRDVSVVCFDDSTPTALGSRFLTSVSRDPVSMGEAAAELLADALRSGSRSPRKLVLPPTLHECQSVMDIRVPGNLYE